jgi:hypothetical protein
VADAESLPHSQGVVTDASSGLLGGEADQVEHLVDAGPGQSHDRRPEGQHLPTGSAGMLRRGIQQHSDLSAGVAQ